jgi:hypothetical protein
MKKVLFITGCLFTLFFTACTKELSSDFNQYTNHPMNDTVWVKTVANTAAVNDLFDLFAPGLIIDSFNLNNGASLRYGDSLEIEIKPNSCVASGGPGTPATGNAVIEILQLKRKGDFIKFFKATTTEKGSLLETGGGLYIRITKEGKELLLAPGSSIKIRFSDIDPAKQNMQSFSGREGNPLPLKGIDTAFYWMRDSDTTWLATWTKPSGNYSGYEMNAKNLRWISADRYIDSNQAKTKITAILSPNFTNKNTAVFAVFANQKIVVNLHGDYPSRSFNTNNIPLKAAIKLISLTNIGGDLYLGVKEISSVATVTSYKIEPEKKSLTDILKFLNGL